MGEGGNRSEQSAAVLLQNELEKYCQSGSLSEEGLRELIEKNHGLTPNQNRLSEYYFFYQACENERVTEGIIRNLHEYFPDAISATTEAGGWSLLYHACSNKNATLGFIQFIVDKAPDSVRIRDSDDGMTPLHCLCENEHVDEATAFDILKLLIEEYPEAAWHADDHGCRPIHYACKWRSHEFCQVLVNAAPDYVSRVDEDGMTPLHYLCSYSYREVDDTAAMQVLNLLIDKYPKRSGIGIVMVIFQFM